MAAAGNVHAAARAVLAECAVEAKCQGAARLWADWCAGRLQTADDSEPLPHDFAGRPARPPLVPPKQLAKRTLKDREGHAALIHALAHIEFNAINLALDAVCRYPGLPDEFYGDWLRVAAEEAYHFGLLRDHLRSLAYDYGDFPAHDGLMQMARDTAADPLARMALVPRLLEARGLDATPEIQQKLRGYGDAAGAAILDIILRDEVTHVAAGDRWFRHFCELRSLEPEATYRELLERYRAPKPRRPVNTEARLQAGFSEAELDALLGRPS
ncbi:MAG: ferritin-like domain-containing protein [Hydrogenophilaceae bacterium]|nr:ferritin-like domain-containing protein [Hydrogenophilaceae bacterium]